MKPKIIAFAYDLGVMAQSVGADIVVINPDSGPGRKGWSGWKDWVGPVKKLTGEVFFYIDALQQDGDAGYSGKVREKSADEIAAEFVRYQERFPGVTRKGVFIDDCTDTPTPQVTRAIAKLRSGGCKSVICNPGNASAAGWEQIADYVVTHESKGYGNLISKIPAEKQIHVALEWKGTADELLKKASGKCAFLGGYGGSDKWKVGGASCYSVPDKLASRLASLK